MNILGADVNIKNFKYRVLTLANFSDPVINGNSNQRANIQRLLEKLILEEDQFDVHDILPNTVPDPASLNLESDYACPVGEVVMAPDCGKTLSFLLQACM